MSIEIKTGTLSDFFASAKEAAKEIDSGKAITPKNHMGECQRLDAFAQA